MKYMLDTHTYLWWVFDAPELSEMARALIADRNNGILVSPASAWEIATKHRLNRLPEAHVLVQDVAGWTRKAGFTELPIETHHAQRAGSFIQQHKDPFDRMIAAQSLVEQLPVIGRNEALRTFVISLVW